MVVYITRMGIFIAFKSSRRPVGFGGERNSSTSIMRSKQMSFSPCASQRHTYNVARLRARAGTGYCMTITDPSSFHCFMTHAS